MLSESSSWSLDRRATNQQPRVLGISGCLVFGGKSLNRSSSRRAMTIDQLPAEATVTFRDDLEMRGDGPVTTLDQRLSLLTPGSAPSADHSHRPEGETGT